MSYFYSQTVHSCVNSQSLDKLFMDLNHTGYIKLLSSVMEFVLHSLIMKIMTAALMVLCLYNMI